MAKLNDDFENFEKELREVSLRQSRLARIRQKLFNQFCQSFRRHALNNAITTDAIKTLAYSYRRVEQTRTRRYVLTAPLQKIPNGKHKQEDLQRDFPGVHGRVVDLCQPSQARFGAAIR